MNRPNYYNGVDRNIGESVMANDIYSRRPINIWYWMTLVAPRTDNPICDRPLYTVWTYADMLCEYIGIFNAPTKLVRKIVNLASADY